MLTWQRSSIDGKECKMANTDTSNTLKCEIPVDNHAESQWNQLDWDKANKIVSRLQTRISKAQKLNETNLVKRLQHLLVNSFYAKALAVRRVSQENKGKHTPGIDGIVWNSDDMKMKATLSLNVGKYKSKALRRIYIPKKNGKLRPLSIPTMYDRAMQALFALALDPVQEATADPSSYGFRIGRSCQDAMRHITNCTSKKGSSQWILEGDIKGCFDNFSHHWILNNIQMDRKILKQFLKAGYIFQERLFPTETGSPQGGVISPIIANMVLNGMEKMIVENIPKARLIRFADDFVVTCRTEEDAEKAKDLISDFLIVRGLELSEEKTKITHIMEGFDFLGWNFRKFKCHDRQKLRVRPSKKSLESIKESIKTTVSGQGKALTQDQLIALLNPKILGWCNYHKNTSVSRTFNYLDFYLYDTLHRWALHRHRNKPKSWVQKRYWHRSGRRNYVFMTENARLTMPSDIKYKRHVMIKSNTNPYIDFEYYAERKARRKLKLERGYRDRSFTS